MFLACPLWSWGLIVGVLDQGNIVTLLDERTLPSGREGSGFSAHDCVHLSPALELACIQWAGKDTLGCLGNECPGEELTHKQGLPACPGKAGGLCARVCLLPMELSNAPAL